MIYEISALNGYELAAKMNKLARFMGVRPNGLETFKHRIIRPFTYEIQALQDIRKHSKFAQLNTTM